MSDSMYLDKYSVADKVAVVTGAANASEAAVHHLTRSLAAEWGSRGIRVNAVAPTYIETKLTSYVHDDPDLSIYWLGGTPMNRMGSVDESLLLCCFSLQKLRAS